MPTMSEKIGRYEDMLGRTKHSKEIILNASYLEAFRATIFVFRDLDIRIYKKDYKNKVISATFNVTSYKSGYGEAYRVFFEKGSENRTKIVLKIVKLSSQMYYKEETILDKIQEEIELQRKLNTER